jgi:hypothetical protein
MIMQTIIFTGGVAHIYSDGTVKIVGGGGTVFLPQHVIVTIGDAIKDDTIRVGDRVVVRNIQINHKVGRGDFHGTAIAFSEEYDVWQIRDDYGNVKWMPEHVMVKE